MKKNKSIKDLLIEYFKAHPKKNMPHDSVVDWVKARYKRLYNKYKNRLMQNHNIGSHRLQLAKLERGISSSYTGCNHHLI